jgi:hypothetical protein
MSEGEEATPPKAEVPDLTAYLDRLRGVLNDEELAKAEFALRKTYAANEVETSGAAVALQAPVSVAAPEVQPALVKPEGVSPDAPSSFMRMLELGVTALVSVVVALVLVSLFGKPPAKPAISFAMLDANIAMAKYLETPGVADLDEQAFGAAVTEFHKALDAEMKQFSVTTGRVLLSGSVIFAGDVPDVTNTLTGAAMEKVARK